jgi:hypothetical protein
MDSIKYVGLDVHRDTISVAVLNAEGKVVMQCVIATPLKSPSPVGTADVPSLHRSG